MPKKNCAHPKCPQAYPPREKSFPVRSLCTNYEYFYDVNVEQSDIYAGGALIYLSFPPIITDIYEIYSYDFVVKRRTFFHVVFSLLFTS